MGKACLRKRNTAPSPALIKPAFPAASILKITSGFLLKDKEACNSIIGLKLKKKKKSNVCSTSENCLQKEKTCLKMMEKKCAKPESQRLGNCEAKGC